MNLQEFNENYFFGLLDEAETCMNSGFPLNENLELIENIINEAKNSSVITSLFEGLTEFIEHTSSDQQLITNKFNTARLRYNRGMVLS